MGKDSKIGWTDHTFNPWIGCMEVSDGCDNCYARVQDARHKWGGATHWGAGVPRHRTSASNWDEPHKWNRQALKDGKPALVFCASLADVFDNEAPQAWRTDLWAVVQETPYLKWLLLTKRIGNAVKMTPPHWIQAPPSNVWFGASVVNQMEADRDIPKLLALPAALRFVSYEPVLGPIDFPGMVYYGTESTGGIVPLRTRGLPQIDWLIIGGESGANRREMSMDAARSAIRQCEQADVAVFVKQDSNFFPGSQGRFTDEEFALKGFPS